ncbi:MAG: acyltransferase family protein [Hydrotalea sp.]|nr:acyltransferase family protein [Hydrotalea sp.]
MSNKTAYRADIDGLRAIAVLLVVGFHAFPYIIRNGFIGVDVFFVISGFLITGIILQGLNNNNFSFVEFYSRRVRRIFPALIIVLIAVLVFGYFYLFPYEYKQLAKHAFGGTAFISNFFFWNEVGYFDNSANTKPLLHLWSLAIEEQFYIIFPCLLFLLYKRKVDLLVALVILWIASFGFNIWEYKHNLTADFYSPLTRFWEILTGAILSYLSLQKKNKHLINNDFIANIMSLAGITIILVSALPHGLVRGGGGHPGISAVLPVLGGAMLIAGRGAANKILSHKFFTSIGLISYPLYLWHWPILSYMTILTSNFDLKYSTTMLYLLHIFPTESIYLLNNIMTLLYKIAAIVVAFLLSYITYQYIEKKIRSGKSQKSKTMMLAIIMAVISIASIILYKFTPAITKNSGNLYQLHYFFSDDNRRVDQACLDYVGIKFYNNVNANNGNSYYCKFNNMHSKTTVALLGHSHAFATYDGVANYLAKKNINTFFITNDIYIKGSNNTCVQGILPPYRPSLTSNEKNICDSSMKKILDILHNKKDIKNIFITDYPFFDHDVDRDPSPRLLIKHLIQDNKKVYLIAHYPTLRNDPRNCITSRPPYNKSSMVDCSFLADHNFAAISSIEKSNNVTIIDPTPAFCPERICSAFSPQGILLYSDWHHLSQAGSQFLAENVLAPYLDKIAKENR